MPVGPIAKQYDHNGLHYTLSIVDSANKYLRLFKKPQKTVSVSKKTAKALIRPTLYTLKRKNVVIEVAYLELIRSCYDKYNTYDGWIAIRNSRELLKFDSLANSIRQIDVEIGNHASVATAPTEGLMCEDSEPQELLDCSPRYLETLEAITKYAPKR